MIVCENVCKSYPRGHSRKQVLRNINLEIAKGDRLALLGRNGAGKTTLIKLIGGVEMPTSGRIRRHMTTSWPLGFNGGFQGSLTGLDNARFISRIYGKNFADMRDFVEDFTELGRQLREPIKTYSAGMKARLAFALSLAVEFDCYLIDEVIMVGDQNFQRKCHVELFEKRADRTLIMASHDKGSVLEYCSRAILIHKGQGEIHSDIHEALDAYSNL